MSKYFPKVLFFILMIFTVFCSENISQKGISKAQLKKLKMYIRKQDQINKKNLGLDSKIINQNKFAKKDLSFEKKRLFLSRDKNLPFKKAMKKLVETEITPASFLVKNSKINHALSHKKTHHVKLVSERNLIQSAKNQSIEKSLDEINKTKENLDQNKLQNKESIFENKNKNFNSESNNLNQSIFGNLNTEEIGKNRRDRLMGHYNCFKNRRRF